MRTFLQLTWQDFIPKVWVFNQSSSFAFRFTSRQYRHSARTNEIAARHFTGIFDA